MPDSQGGRSGWEIAKNSTDIRRYGKWALVAGASEGLGAAYARALAARGLDLVLVARRRGPLEELSEELRTTSGVEVVACPGDLGDAGFLDGLVAVCGDLEVGLLVYNAAYAPLGGFCEAKVDDLTRVVDVNVRAPVVLTRALLPAMTERGRGAVILMTSLAGNQGTARLAAYAASKAFNRVLAEGLWSEMCDRGVDVLACCAGAVKTPGYAAAAGKDAPGTLAAEDVVERTLRSLRRGPVFVPGLTNKLAGQVMARILPRRAAVFIMKGSTDGLVSAPDGKGGS